MLLAKISFVHGPASRLDDNIISFLIGRPISLAIIWLGGEKFTVVCEMKEATSSAEGQQTRYTCQDTSRRLSTVASWLGRLGPTWMSRKRLRQLDLSRPTSSPPWKVIYLLFQLNPLGTITKRCYLCILPRSLSSEATFLRFTLLSSRQRTVSATPLFRAQSVNNLMNTRIHIDACTRENRGDHSRVKALHRGEQRNSIFTHLGLDMNFSILNSI